MTKINKFSDFIKEEYKIDNDYSVGDIVMIRYNLTGDITPVKIIAKKTHKFFIVSHNVKDGFLQNAPDHGIKSSEIIGKIESVSDPVDTVDRKIENPTIQPSISGIIPGWNSYNNEISF